MLTHDRILVNSRATTELLSFGPELSALSFLPLSHVLQFQHSRVWRRQ